MFLELVTAPAAALLSTAAAKDHCRLTSADDDEYVDELVVSASAEIEVITGRAVVEQTWRANLDGFPSGAARIYLPKPPLISIEEITYTDSDGSPQILVEDTDFKVFAPSGPTATHGWVEPLPGGAWPAAQAATGSVQIEFKAGYSTDAIPAPLVQACRLTIAHWERHREEVVIGTISNKVPRSAAALLSPFLVYEVC